MHAKNKVNYNQFYELEACEETFNEIRALHLHMCNFLRPQSISKSAIAARQEQKVVFRPFTDSTAHINESSQDIQQIQLDFHSFSCFLFSSLPSHNIACSSMHSWESERRRGDNESVGFDGAATTTTTKKLMCCFFCCVWWGIHRESNESSGKLKDDGTRRDDEQ